MKIKTTSLLIALGLSLSSYSNLLSDNFVKDNCIECSEHDFAADFENFTFDVGLKNVDELSAYFVDEEMYDATIDIITSEHYMNQIALKTYALLEDDYIAGEPVKNLTIYMSDDEDEMMYLTLSFQETEDGLMIVDYFIPEP